MDEGYPQQVSSRETDLFRAMAKAVFLAAGLVALFWFLIRVTWVLLFFTLATVLALALNAPVTWLERRGTPRLLATLAVFGALGALMGVIVWMIGPPLVREITTLINSLPVHASAFADRVADLLRDYPQLEQQLRIDQQTASQFVPWVMGTLQNLWYYGLSLVLLLVLGLVLFGIVLYMVLDPRPLLSAYVSAFPPHLRDPAIRAFTRASQMVVGWVYASTIISAMKAIPAFFFLSWIGLPGALVWAVFTFFADLVPRLGFYLMIVPPTLVALTIDPQMALWVALFYWALSEILGNFVAPKIQASTMNLHAVFLLFITLAMVAAFGVLGAIIASPVAGFIKAYYEEFYLARLPKPSRLPERVEGMLSRTFTSGDLQPPGEEPVGAEAIEE
ncbi:MAG: AI-2E family transporter [Gemmatimonadetes bacterium]|nr:AI-2E family transporter [Gemmatimonadota bacterium]